MSHTRGAEEIFESVGEQEVRTQPPVASKPISSDIATEHLAPVAAFEYFHGRIYDNNLSAYENMLRDSKNKHRGEVSYSLADDLERSRGAESPFQRFARLKAEMQQLSSDLTSMTRDEGAAEGSGGSVSECGSGVGSEECVWRTLQAETNHMLSKLSTMEGPSKELSETQGLSSTKHVDQVARLLADQQNKQNKQSHSLTHSSTGEQSIANSDDVARLEQRVYALELLVGVSSTNTDMMSLITGGAKTFPLLENLSSLESRVNLLDPVVLDMVSVKVNQLISDLETLNKAQSKTKAKNTKGGASSSSSSSSSSMSDDQLGSLASKLESLDGFETELPGLLLRLKTLATVHQEAASFSARLTDLEDSADELSALSQSNSEVMATLQEGLFSNIQTFKENLETLDSRINKLS